MKIVLLDGYVANPGDLSWEALEKLGDLTVYDRTPKEEIIKRIGDAELVLTNKTPIAADTLEACPNIRYIGVLATGYNVVDVEKAKEKGIVVTNIPSYSTATVAQMVFALLLELCSRPAHYNEAVQRGRWASSPDFCFWDDPIMELSGKTMGIIGYGTIGQAVGRIAEAFGMKVLAYNFSRVTEKSVDLDTLYRESDVISLHCPLTPLTERMINKQTIAKMKDSVILINTARGPLVEEEDLAEALRSRKIHGAGIDVVSEEPIRADNPLLGIENCLITPHVSWASIESRKRLLQMTAHNLAQFLKGTPVNAL